MSIYSNVITSGSDKSIPAINGIVSVACATPSGTKQYELRVEKGLFITDAYKAGEDQYFSCLKGQSQEYLVTGIFRECKSAEMETRKYLTCLFLDQIQKAVDKGEVYVDTVFGVKYLDWVKPREKKVVCSLIDL